MTVITLTNKGDRDRSDKFFYRGQDWMETFECNWRVEINSSKIQTALVAFMRYLSEMTYRSESKKYIVTDWQISDEELVAFRKIDLDDYASKTNRM